MVPPKEQHRQQQNYQPPLLTQMPASQIIDGQSVFFVPMVLSENGSVFPMTYGMPSPALAPLQAHMSLSPLPDVIFAANLSASENIALAMYQYYQDIYTYQESLLPEETRSSKEDTISNGDSSVSENENVSTSFDDMNAVAPTSASLFPHLPSTPPPKGQL